MLDSALQALAILSDPVRLGFLCLGTFCGLIVGIIPGIGGLVGFALLMPFTFSMDPFTALAFLIGASAVSTTSDTIPAVLFGVPGTVGSAATVIDGYPMSQRGEAGRAFGAAFSASMLGGVLGAVPLLVAIPLLAVMTQFIGSPELLAICLLGITMVTAVSQGAMLRGIALASFGVLLACIGDEAQTGELRWVYGQIYLWDGLSLIPLALGLFAIPDLVDLANRGGSISDVGAPRRTTSGRRTGVTDTIRNMPIVLRSASIGSVLGAVPGIGSAIIDWFAYGVAAKVAAATGKPFAKGDVRGVIASESANNAKEAGALIPTQAFGVPGSASMALLLGALLIHGISPGENLLNSNLHVTYTLVFSIVIANILGAGLCFAFADHLAKVTGIKAGMLVPVVLAVTMVGAFQGNRDIGDLYVLVIFGAIGWIMKRGGWPRAPLLLGFVLGGLMETYLFISVSRYEMSWLWRPGVVLLLGIAIALIFWPMVQRLIRQKQTRAPSDSAVGGYSTPRRPSLMGSALVCVFVFSILTSASWTFEARLMPLVAGCFGLSFLALDYFGNVNRDNTQGLGGHTAFGSRSAVLINPAVLQFGWILGALALILVIGMLPALFAFMWLHMWIDGKRPAFRALLSAMVACGGLYLIFDLLLHIPWPDPLLGFGWE